MFLVSYPSLPKCPPSIEADLSRFHSFDTSMVEVYRMLGRTVQQDFDVLAGQLDLLAVLKGIPDLDISVLSNKSQASVPYTVVSHTSILSDKGLRILFFVISGVKRIADPDVMAAEPHRRGLTWKNSEALHWKSELCGSESEVVSACLAYWSEFHPIQALSCVQRIYSSKES